MNNQTQKKEVLPVIHVESEEQALRNAKLAQKCCADGIFIISHGNMSSKALLVLAKKIKQELNGFWTGVNCLGWSADEIAQQVPQEIDGVWTDNAGVDERIDEQDYAQIVKQTFEKRSWEGLYFGGVAFKYQRKVENLEIAVEKSKPFMDVICTSGVGTGYAADLEKIKRMKSAAKEFPLAIASGITPDNITNYLPYIDYFLVATGIGKTFTEIDEAKLTELVEKVRKYENEFGIE